MNSNRGNSSPSGGRSNQNGKPAPQGAKPTQPVNRFLKRVQSSMRHGKFAMPCVALGLAIGAGALYGGGLVAVPGLSARRNSSIGGDLSSPSPASMPSSNQKRDVSAASTPSSNQQTPPVFGKALKLNSAASMLPHPEKEHRGGEDAYFIHAGDYCIGVADGVGGWAEVGVDPGLYSRELMSHALNLLDDVESVHPGVPQRILEEAHARTRARGSCTACIVCLHEGQAHASNLGDSGFLVARDGAVAFISPQQQHEFNFPYQIGSPDSMSDSPSKANSHVVDLRPGDIVIAATDGLFDNVFPDEAAALVHLSKKKGEGPAEAAAALSKYAKSRALDPKYLSPFAYGAQQMGYRYLGGKLDDITVVVSYVDEHGDAQ